MMGALAAEVTHSVQRGWKTGSVSANMNIRGKGFRIVVKPALLYGVETWVLEKEQENKLEVAEIRMLRWIC